MANYQTGGYKFRPTKSWYTEESDRVGLLPFRLRTHSLNPHKCDDQGPRHRLTLLNSK